MAQRTTIPPLYTTHSHLGPTFEAKRGIQSLPLDLVCVWRTQRSEAALVREALGVLLDKHRETF